MLGLTGLTAFVLWEVVIIVRSCCPLVRRMAMLLVASVRVMEVLISFALTIRVGDMSILTIGCFLG